MAKGRVCPYDCMYRMQDGHRVFVQCDKGGEVYELIGTCRICEWKTKAKSLWTYKGFTLRNVNNHAIILQIRNSLLSKHFDMYEFAGGLPPC